MSLSNTARLVALLARLGRYNPDQRPDPRVKEQRSLHTVHGTEFDLFTPSKQPLGVVLAVHGLTFNGKNDVRLLHFGRCLAQSRVICVIPSLPALSQLCWEESDIDALVELVAEVHRRTGMSVGLVGFSYGASYALLAAARPQAQNQVRFVIGFGAFHSFPAMYDAYLANRFIAPQNEEEWDNHIYLHLILSYRLRQQLRLSSGLVSDIEMLLKRYCHESSAQEKRVFYEQHLRGLDLVATDHALQAREALWRLSPAGRLAGLKCPVGLIHDPNDTLVPVSHARELFSELQTLPHPERFRLLVTPLMNHITLASVCNPAEIVKLLSILSPLISAAPEAY